MYAPAPPEGAKHISINFFQFHIKMTLLLLINNTADNNGKRFFKSPGRLILTKAFNHRKYTQSDAQKPVTHTRFSNNNLRIGWIIFDFFPQLENIYPEITRVRL